MVNIKLNGFHLYITGLKGTYTIILEVGTKPYNCHATKTKLIAGNDTNKEFDNSVKCYILQCNFGKNTNQNDAKYDLGVFTNAKLETVFLI